MRPRTTTGQFSVSLKNIGQLELGQEAILKIFNMLGQEVFNTNYLLKKGATLSLNFSDKAKGMYLISLQANGKILHSKIVLQ